MGLNFKAITKVLGILTLIEGVFMLAALATAMYYGEWAAASALLTTSLLCYFNADEIRQDNSAGKRRILHCLRKLDILLCPWCSSDLFLWRRLFIYQLPL